MSPLQLEKSEAVHSIYIVSFRLLQILTVRSMTRRASALHYQNLLLRHSYLFQYNAAMTSTAKTNKQKKDKVKSFSVLVYISLPLKLLFLLSFV